MSNILRYVVCVGVSLIVGAGAAAALLVGSTSTTIEMQRLRSLSTLERMAVAVYDTGDNGATVVAFKTLLEELTNQMDQLTPEDRNFAILRSDLGLTYARLFIVYDRTGKEDLARTAYERAKGLLEANYRINSTDDLKATIQRLDAARSAEP